MNPKIAAIFIPIIGFAFFTTVSGQKNQPPATTPAPKPTTTKKGLETTSHTAEMTTKPEPVVNGAGGVSSDEAIRGQIVTQVKAIKNALMALAKTITDTMKDAVKRTMAMYTKSVNEELEKND